MLRVERVSKTFHNPFNEKSLRIGYNISMNKIQKVKDSLDSKESVRNLIKNYKLSDPKKLLDFYFELGGFVSFWEKRIITNQFIKMYDYTSEDIKQVRLTDEKYKNINKMGTIARYHDKVKLSKEFSDKSRSPITDEDLDRFEKLKESKLTDMEIAKELQRTFSSIEYMKKLVRKRNDAKRKDS